PPLDIDDIVHPTGAEYATHAAREFLNILEAIAQVIPIPGFGPAVKIAVSIMKACDECHATLESAQELKIRIKRLVVVLVDDLKGKEMNEIPPKLFKDVQSLKNDMHYIDGKLNQITSRNHIFAAFFRSLDDEILAREMEHTDMLSRLEQKITMFHAPLNKLQVTMDGVKAMLDDHPPSNVVPSSSLSTRSVMPANTISFHGRKPIVAELVSVVVGPSRRHICLTGPGGMGKTSTSLAVMSHVDVEARFPDQLRVWVPCVKAPTVSLFVETLHTSLGISNKSGNPLSDIISELSSSPPVVLLLDNFETTWNAEGGQSEAEGVLRCIHRLPHVTLFIHNQVVNTALW
ncbi:hypothetical protein H0H87_005346, partial [Tephrocybe sp. NHM501043]